MSGPLDLVEEVTTKLQERCRLTVGNLLLKEKDECSMVGRKFFRTVDGYTLEGDVGLCKRSLSELSLSEAKTAPTPSVSSSLSSSLDSQPLPPHLHALYRTLVGRLLYISSDRIDLQFTAKHLARSLHCPTFTELTQLKRCFRYISGRPTLPCAINCSRRPTVLKVYSDADWASCRKTRRSTSGGCIAIDDCLVHA